MTDLLDDVPRETMSRLEDLVDFLRAENERQNLVSAGSLEDVWTRHIADSAQLVHRAPAQAATWLDLGTGAGFPGLVVALLHGARVTMVDSRKLRTAFLAQAAERLGVGGKVEILTGRVETLTARPFDVISARAFAPLPRLLDLAHRFSTEETVWVLPKGRNAKSELDEALRSWQGDFRLEPSRTDEDARIIVARHVRRKPQGKRAR